MFSLLLIINQKNFLYIFESNLSQFSKQDLKKLPLKNYGDKEFAHLWKKRIDSREHVLGVRGLDFWDPKFEQEWVVL